MGKIALALLVLLPVSACAEQDLEVTVSQAVDVYWPRNAADGQFNDSVGTANALILKQGFTQAYAKVQRQSAIGGRVGFLKRVLDRDRLSWGASLGYVSGPNSKAIVSGTDAALTYGEMIDDRRLQFVTYLAQVRAILPLRGSWSLDLGGGAGAATGFERDSCTASGSLVGSCRFDAVSASWTGFAWELSPGLAYRVNNTHITLGMRYAGFPQFAGTGNTSRIVWTPLGAFISAVFHLD